jgi:uncharacterized membrane protein YraQ (UPF0718 family)
MESTLNYSQEIFTLFLGLTIEAFPFIVLGVSISTLIALYVKEDKVLEYLPKNKFISHAVTGFFGMFIPVCECGNIPVARRLLMKGFSVSQATTFLLAAPIVNPITFITTLEAFNVDKNIAIMRLVFGYLIALIIGLVISYKRDQNSFLRDEFVTETCEVHDHEHEKHRGLEIFQREFIGVFRLLFIGAFIAALTQTLVPREFLNTIGADPILSILAMIFLGLVVSICSNVDAFFALSYSTTFTLGSLMAFMLFGPMIDIKILSMLKSTFKTRFLVWLTTAVAVSALLVGVGINVFYRPFL